MSVRFGSMTTSWWFALAVVGGIAALVVIPVGSTAYIAVRIILAIGVIGAAVMRLVSSSGAVAAPWRWLVAGVAVSASADIAQLVLSRSGVVIEFGDGLYSAYPIAVGLLIAGLLTMAGPTRHVDRLAVLDAIVIVTSVVAVVWIIVIAPMWHFFAISWPARIAGAALPLLYVCLAMAAVRLLRRVERPNLAVGFVVCGVFLQVLVGSALAVLVASAPHTPIPGWLDAGWLASDALIVAAVLHPSATRTPSMRQPRQLHLEPGRAVALVAAATLLPATLLLIAHDGREVVLATLTAIVFVLFSIRIWALMQRLERGTRSRVEHQKERDQRRFAALIRHMTDVLVVVDEEGVITFASQSAKQLYGDDPTGWRVKDIAAFVHPDERRATVGAIIDRINNQPGESARMNARLLDRDGQPQYIDLTISDLRDDPDVQGIVLTMQETTERTELLRQLRELAFHDPLTGLGNRELFRDRLNRALARTTRSGGRIAVLMCDLDDFKDVNDTLGHASGDQLLVELARRLRAGAGPSDTIARLGGDEFAILLEGVGSARNAATKARSFLEMADEPIEVAGRQLRVGISIGVVVDTGERTGDELLRDADIALYEAKNQGKRRWMLHRTAMTIRNQSRVQLVDDLTHALANGDLQLAYQPITDLHAGAIVGVEALARWEHPVRGMITPTEFVEVAETSGLVTAIGSHLLDDALRTLQRLRQEHPHVVLRMAVNVSTRELREPSLVNQVLDQLQRHAIDPSWLILEVTETSMLDDTQLTLAVMRELRDAGVRFAVDDFGTGYSSLSYLRQLPVDIVKIDRVFINDLGLDDTSTDLVRAIIELGRSLQLDVCAEGVETVEQEDLLRTLGCGFTQGFLYGRPVDEDDLMELLRGPTVRLVSSA